MKFAHFFFDPLVGLGHARAQVDFRLPAEHALDQRVVAVAAADALGSIEIVVPLDLDPGNLLHDIHQLVDGDEFAPAQVEGILITGFGPDIQVIFHYSGFTPDLMENQLLILKKMCLLNPENLSISHSKE